MPEIDAFERRLSAAVRAFADRADTGVDASALAQRAIGRQRFPSIVWFGRPVPVVASIVVLLALLLALIGLSMQIGGRPESRLSIAPVTAASATFVSGGGSFSIVNAGTSTSTDEVVRLRGYVASSTDTMNDPRATGTGTLLLTIDEYGPVGTEWGTYRLENAGGAWEGSVAGAGWAAGEASTVSGWLAGSGSYEGYTYYIRVRSSGLQTELSGVIYPGSPPARQSPEAR